MDIRKGTQVTCWRQIHIHTLEDVSENKPDFPIIWESDNQIPLNGPRHLKIPWFISKVFITMKKSPREANVIKKKVSFFRILYIQGHSSGLGSTMARKFMILMTTSHHCRRIRCLDMHVWPFWPFPLISLSGFIYGYPILVSSLILNTL